MSPNSPAPRRDPRAQRTRASLQRALLDLIGRDGYTPITIHDITTRAGVNRGTFYLHYRDKLDLLTQCLDAVRDELEASARPPADTAHLLSDTPPPMLLALLQHVADHAAFYRVMLGKAGVPEAAAHIRSHIEQFLGARLALRRGSAADTPPIMVAGRYTAAAYLGVLVWWLEQPAPPPQMEVAAWLWQLTRHGLAPLVAGRG